MNKPKIYYQEDCNLALLEGKRLPSSDMEARDMHMP